MKIFISVLLFALSFNFAFTEEIKSEYKTIKLSSGSPYPMEMNQLTGVFGVYAPDVVHGLMSFGQEEYTGELKDGKPHGYGERKGSDNFYKGEWKEGKYHGYGVFSQPRSDYKYAGEWKNGLREGKGILEYPWHIYLDSSNPEKYYFEYNRDVKRESYDFSFRYEGTFKNDLASGIGKCFTKEYNEQHKPTVSEYEFINGILSSKIKLPNAMTIGPVKEILKAEKYQADKQ